jgi:hypothetical protein
MFDFYITEGVFITEAVVLRREFPVSKSTRGIQRGRSLTPLFLAIGTIGLVDLRLSERNKREKKIAASQWNGGDNLGES